MKKQILSFILGAVVALTITMVPAVADSISKKIDVLVDYVSVTLDGKEVEVANFVHEGRTYLGLRDMGNLLGLQVDWDDVTQTAILTSPGKTPVWPVHKQVIEIPIARPTTITVDGTPLDSAWIEETINNYKTNYPDAPDSDIKNAILDDAKWYNFCQIGYEKYSITEKEEYKNDAQKLYDDMVKSYGGEEAFALLAASSGVEVDTYKADYIKNYIESQLVNELTNNLVEENEEIQALKASEKAKFEADKELANFPKATVKHILVPAGDNAKKDAEKVVARLKKGEDFDKILEEFRENDPGMPNTGYEVYRDSGFVPEFEEASLKLKKGEFSGAVESDYGFHIIYCLEKTETITFDEYFQMNFTDEVNTVLNKIYSDWSESVKIDVTWGF